MFRLLKVSGDSLSPRYREGDFVLVAKIPFFFSTIRKGDIVAFRHPSYGTMIKKVDHVLPDKDEIFVIGTHGDSVDSRQFGAISKGTLVGKLLWHIRKPLR